MPDLTLLQPFNLNTTGNFTFANTSVTGNLSSGNANLGNLVLANYFSGNGSLLTGIIASSATTAATVTTNAQPNITSVGTLASLTVTGNITSGNASLGNLVTATYFSGNGSLLTGLPSGYANSDVATFLASYGSNIISTTGNVTAGYFIGNGSTLSAIAGANVTGNVTSAVQSHFANIANSVAGSNVSGQVGNALVAGTVYTNAQPNITSVGTLVSLTVTGNITSGNASLGNLASATYFSGDGSFLTNITGANVTGIVANATYATSAGSATTAATVTTNAQPNITSVGTLASLTVTGNVTSGNASLGNLASATYFSGNGSLLTGITGTYSNSNVAAYLPTYTGNFTAGNANVTGTITVASITTSGSAGNITGANYINANYFIGDGSLLTGLPASYSNSNVAAYLPTYTGNFTAGNANITGTMTVASITTSGSAGNITGANYVISNYFSGNGSLLTSITGGNVTGNVTSAVQSHFANIANSVAGSNISGQVGNALVAGTVYTNAQPNITSVGTLASLTVTGNITSGNASLGNLASATYFSGDGNLLTNITGGNVTGNVTSAVQSHFANIANSVAGSNISGQVGNALVAGTVYTNAQPNITSVGTLVSLSVSGDATVTGNFTVGGTTTYINVETFRVEDPIIELGGGANGDPLTTNDGKDRGTLLHYYTTGVVDAFMGWDNSNGEFAFGSNVSVSSEVVTFNNFGNIRASYFIGNGSQLTGTIANANYSTYAGTVITAAQPNITSVGTLASLSITGNVTSGNASLGNLATASYFSGDGSLLTGIVAGYSNTNVAAYLPTYTGNVSANYFIGNGSTLTYITGANVNGNVTSAVQSHYANIANSVAGGNVSGQVGNALVAGTVYTNAQPNITSVGSLTGLTVSNATGVVDFTTTANVTLGAVSNLHISGGTDGYVLKTNGSGTLAWVAQPTPGGSDTQVQFNDGGSFGGNSAFTFNKITGNVVITGNLVTGSGTGGNISGLNYVTANYLTGTLTTAVQPNITSVGTLASLTVTGNITSGNASLGNLATASYFTGNGSLLTYITGSNVIGNVTSAVQSHYANIANSVAGSNVSGQVGNALVAGTVYTNAQPNITSVGSLSSLTVTGLITATGTGLKAANVQDSSGTITITTKYNNVSGDVGIYGNLNVGTSGTGFFIGNGSYLSGLTGGNVSGQVGNALVAGTVYTNAQPNITSVGTIAGLTGTGVFDLTGTSNVALGAVGNVHISGGTAGYVLSTDGSGALSWVAQSGGGGGSYGNSNVADYLPTYTGNVSANYFIGNGSVLTGQVGNALIASTVYTNAQPNITSVGSLSGLTVSNATGVVNFTTTANVTLGNVSNLHISGGSANYVLQTDGSGALSWVAQSGGGGGGSPTITDDTTTNATYYPVYATASSGSLSTAGVSSTKLQFNPSLGQLTITDLNSLSDATLKTNWQTIDDPFSILDQLFGMGFEWTDNGRKSYGLSAQNVEQILPELVGTTAQGKKTVNYIPIIAFLLEALKKNNKELQEIRNSIKPKRQSTKKDK
jgi:hypothetical protein